MSTIGLWVKKIWLIAGILALGSAFMPVACAGALSPTDAPTPPAPNQNVGSHLEQAWAREQDTHNKLGTFFNGIDERITKGQELINKAKANGKDTSTLQKALDTFSNAVEQAKPIDQSMNGIISSHKGFDENGNVTDRVQAFLTVSDLRVKIFEIHQLLYEPGKALRDAIKTFRSENSPSTAPAPTQSGS
jgi:hypothetical protein